MLSRAAAAPSAIAAHLGRALSSTAPALATTVQRLRFPVTTRDSLEHYEIVREIGVVAGGDVRTKNLVKDILAAFAGMFGGETTYYSHLLNESSAASVDKLVDHAKHMQADAVVGMRFNTAATMNRLIAGLHSVVMVYGTAVELRPKDPAVDPFGIGPQRRGRAVEVGAFETNPASSVDGEAPLVSEPSAAPSTGTFASQSTMTEEEYQALIMRTGSVEAR